MSPNIVVTMRDGWPHYRHDDGSCEEYGCTPIDTKGKTVDQLQAEWAKEERAKQASTEA